LGAVGAVNLTIAKAVPGKPVKKLSKTAKKIEKPAKKIHMPVVSSDDARQVKVPSRLHHSSPCVLFHGGHHTQRTSL
jgi:hypothetical protein